MAEIKATISLDATRFEQGISRADRGALRLGQTLGRLSGVGGPLGSMFNQLAMAMDGCSGSLTQMAVTAGKGLGILTIIQELTWAKDKFDELKKASEEANAAMAPTQAKGNESGAWSEYGKAWGRVANKGLKFFGFNELPGEMGIAPMSLPAQSTAERAAAKAEARGSGFDKVFKEIQPKSIKDKLEEWYVNPFRKLAPTIEETKAMFDSLNQQAELAKQKPELNKPFIGGDSLSAIGGFIGKGGPAQYIPQKQLSAQEQANQILKEIRDRVSIAQPVVA